MNNVIAEIQNRIDGLRQCIGPLDEYGDDVQNQMRDEITFLENLLQIVEKQ